MFLGLLSNIRKFIKILRKLLHVCLSILGGVIFKQESPILNKVTPTFSICVQMTLKRKRDDGL